MPAYEPPLAAPNRARITTLSAGTILYRVHSASLLAAGFNPTPPDSPFAAGGGRFDSLTGTPGVLYCAASIETAIAEGILRRARFDEHGRRRVARIDIAARCLSRLRTTAPLRLVSLHGDGLARVGQDTWLVHCPPPEYVQTREWGAAIMGWNPSAAGLAWHPRHDDDGLAVCLYEDRAPGCVLAEETIALDSPEGRELVDRALARFGAVGPG